MSSPMSVGANGNVLVSPPSHHIDIHAPPCWDDLPSDLIHLIAQHLDARSIARLSSLKRTSHQTVLTHHTNLWLSVLNSSEPWRAEWLDQTALKERMKISFLNEGEREKDPERYFLTRLRHTLLMKLVVMEKRSQAQEEHASKTRIYFMRFYEECILPLLLLMLFCTFVGLMVYQLVENEEEVTFLCFWPLLVIGFLIFLSTCNLLYINYRAQSPQKSYLHHILPDEYYNESQSFVKHAMESIGAEDGTDATGHVTFCIMLLLLFIFLLLIMLRCTHTITCSWSTVFIPFYIILPLFCCGGSHWKDEEEGGVFAQLAWMITLLVFGSPVMIFFLLLLLYLLDISGITRLSIVFIPLYFFDFLTLLYTFALIRREDEDDVEGLIITWLLSDGMFIVFKALLGARVDGVLTSSYAVVFLPVYITLVVSLGIMFAYAVVNTRKLMKERVEQFERLRHVYESSELILDPPIDPKLMHLKLPTLPPARAAKGVNEIVSEKKESRLRKWNQQLKRGEFHHADHL